VVSKARQVSLVPLVLTVRLAFLVLQAQLDRLVFLVRLVLVLLVLPG
jgi:hypothetical protein